MFAAEKSIKNKIGLPKKSDLLPIGAADRGRTGTDFTPRDFKSLVSAYSTTAAFFTILLYHHCRHLSRLFSKKSTATAFTFWELFKSPVSFTKFVCFTDVPPKGDTQVEKGGGTN